MYKITHECTACYVCYDHCPEKAIIPSEIFKIDYNKCTECGECLEICPIDVIIYIPSKSPQELKKENP